MKWIDRYVAEVRRYLPAGNRDDIGEELESLLEEELLAREADRERPLEEGEVLDFLREFGHPMRVAARYGANGVLVSGALFPLYRKVVRYMVAAVALVYVLAVVWDVVADVVWDVAAGDRSVHLSFGFGEAWGFTVNWLVFITLGFHLADRHLTRSGELERWNPATLPPAQVRRESLFTCVLVSILLAVWLVVLQRLSPEFSVSTLMGEGMNRFATFLAWLKIQAVLTLAVYLTLLFRPHWSPGKRVAIMVADLSAMVGAAIALRLEPRGLLEHYPSLPEGLISVSSVLLWIWLVALLVGLLAQGYRLREQGSGASRGE